MTTRLSDQAVSCASQQFRPVRDSIAKAWHQMRDGAEGNRGSGLSRRRPAHHVLSRLAQAEHFPGQPGLPDTRGTSQDHRLRTALC